MRSIALTLFVVLFASCTVGPDYKPYHTEAPDVWSLAIKIDESKKLTSYQKWWKNYKDKELESLIQQARSRNPNLKRARSRISTAWYQRGVLRAAFFPSSGFFATDQHGILNFDKDEFNIDPFSSQETVIQQTLGWDLDIFGQNKRIVEAQTAQYESQIEGWRDAMIFITAEVAIHYFALRTLEARIETSEEAIATFTEMYRIIKTRHELGIAPELEVTEAHSRLRVQESVKPQLQREMALVKNKLASLCGMYPTQLNEYMTFNTADIPIPPKNIDTGIPVDILRSRPDVRRAERDIAAQSARVGVATAELYPKLSISGAISYRFLQSGGITELLQRVGGLGPTVRWNVFNAGRDRNRIEENKSILEEVIQTYEATVYAAVEEVENSLSLVKNESIRVKQLKEAAASQKKNASQMIEAYKTGLVDVRRLLNAQRDYFFVKDEKQATEGRAAAFTARLYRSLGGGEIMIPKDIKKGVSYPQRSQYKKENEETEKRLNPLLN